MNRMNAKQIQALLDRFGLRATDLAAGAGVTDDAVRKWLQGASRPSTSTQKRINDYVKHLELTASADSK